ncbi:MAG TPA: hypothetical protein VG755_11375 [Nannocystaceae bacterium]|nr:hypothetical protein [Nannocystaceae bacterium]
MWGRARACAGAIFAIVANGCLDPNPDFDGPASEASSAADGAGESTTEASCLADGYEPNDLQSAAIPFGTFTLVLETVDAIDTYSLWVAPEAPELFHATADADVRVCGFVRCEGVVEAPQVECTMGLSGGNENGDPGCCGGPELALAFVCGGDTSAKIVVSVDDAPADCTSYGLELVNG